jgi:phospholipid/cholesterol/gamma-HCH transport system substrate-binding protein
LKVSNETKVGVVAAVSIIVLILGYTYLRGVDLFDKGINYYATYEKIAGLDVSDDVNLNGVEVGRISSIDQQITGNQVLITVGFSLNEDIPLPINSEISIVVDLLGSVGLEIRLGDSQDIAPHGHTFKGSYVPGIQEQVERALDPVVGTVTKLVNNVDSFVTQLQFVFDPQFSADVEQQMTSITTAITNIRSITQRIDDLLASQAGNINKTFTNLASLSDSLEANKGHISTTLKNLSAISDSLAAADITKTFNDLSATIDELQQVVDRFNDPNNSMGMLLSDRELYESMVSSVKSLDTLVTEWKDRINVVLEIHLGRQKEKKKVE